MFRLPRPWKTTLSTMSRVKWPCRYTSDRACHGQQTQLLRSPLLLVPRPLSVSTTWQFCEFNRPDSLSGTRTLPRLSLTGTNAHVGHPIWLGSVSVSRKTLLVFRGWEVAYIGHRRPFSRYGWYQVSHKVSGRFQPVTRPLPPYVEREKK